MNAKEASEFVVALAAVWDKELSPERALSYVETVLPFQASKRDLAMQRIKRKSNSFPGPAILIEAFEGTAQEREREAFNARLEEQRQALQAPPLPAGIIARGAGLVRAVLSNKGVEAPKDEKHAEAFDPPLNKAEQRHRVHAIQEPEDRPYDRCRFCRTEREHGAGAA